MIMIKKILVRWIEHHEQVIYADPETDELLMIVNVNDHSPTYKTCESGRHEILGDAPEPEISDYEYPENNVG
ncbi:hypothetical protein KKH13_05025 [Patescibacteria group bacterium]|nr:hypothetical protein [Patescibacteria group bacterium]